MADGVRPQASGRRRRGPRAPRDTGTTQTNALTQEDALKRKAKLEAAVRKKIEFERKALRIVEQLLEENITEESLKEGSSSHLLTIVMSWTSALSSNSVVIPCVRRN